MSELDLSRGQDENKNTPIINSAKEATKDVGGSKGGILNFLFGGWHKWVFIALVVVVALAVVTYFIEKPIQREPEDKASIEKYSNSLTEKVEQSDWDREVYMSAVNEFKAKRDAALSGDGAYYYGYYYAEFVYRNGISVNDSKIAFSEIPEKDDISKDDACALKSLYRKIYSVDEIEDDAPLKEVMEECDGE